MSGRADRPAPGRLGHRCPRRLPPDGSLTEAQRAKLDMAEAACATTTHRVFVAATVGDVRLQARGFQRKHGLGLVVVDNLHDLAPPVEAESRQVEVAASAEALKGLARDLGCVVVALAQLNSGPATRADKRPELWDIRDRRRVAQLADVVLLIYRDDVYNPASQDRGIAEVTFTATRNGPTGTSRLAWLPSIPCFADLAMEPAF